MIYRALEAIISKLRECTAFDSNTFWLIVKREKQRKDELALSISIIENDYPCRS